TKQKVPHKLQWGSERVKCAKCQVDWYLSFSQCRSEGQEALSFQERQKSSDISLATAR
ncbi:Secretory phospholipase A2 receptor, partial [Dissostichus eleginoides]